MIPFNQKIFQVVENSWKIKNLECHTINFFSCNHILLLPNSKSLSLQFVQYSHAKKDTHAHTYQNTEWITFIHNYISTLALCKWGHFERAKTIFKILLSSWRDTVLIMGSRSFQTVYLCSLMGYKVSSYESWRLRKTLLSSKSRTTTMWPRFESEMIGSSSKFEAL